METRPSPQSGAVTIHPLDRDDAPFADSFRAMVSRAKGTQRGLEARQQFDAVMERVPAREDVTFESDVIGGVPGVWVHRADWRLCDAILHVHGGWFNFGSAHAYRHFAGHIAARAGARTFVPDYRLAPEHPFPAAVEDVLAVFRGLAEKNVYRVVLSGDSAGGNLALALAGFVSGGATSGDSIRGVGVFSPVTDLTLSGASYQTRAEADPLFTHSQIAELVRAYLGDADPRQPLASPLYLDLSDMPPVRIHVGDDEVLLDDSLRFVERAVAEGVDAHVDVWTGMPHGFTANIGKQKAAALALDAMGAFLAERLQDRGEQTTIA